jgi:LacI family transcriptional regulator
MKKVTILDIARAAGVSYQTVSRVLNGKPDVAADTRARIDDVIRELGYRPSDLARGLRSKSTRTIGLLVPDSANPFFAEIAKGVESAGFAAGYSVILCNAAKDPAREYEYLELLQSKGVDGLIFIAASPDIAHLRPRVEAGLPVVLFYRDAEGLPVDTFQVDNSFAGRLAAQHLIALGHRHIACIQPASEATPSGRRVDGFRNTLREAGIDLPPVLMPRGDNLLSGGERAAYELLASEQHFTAIFAANDAMAIGAMRTLREAGLRIPHDISIMGMDDIVLASYVDPPLTTLYQPKQEAGEQAARALIARIEGQTVEPRNTVLECRLVERASTAPYRSQS